MVTTLYEKLMIRFQRIEDNVLITQATLLDPRFKKHGFIHDEKCSTAISHLRSKVQSIRVEESRTPQPNVILPSVSLPTSSTAIWEDFDETVVNVIGGNNSTAAGIIELDKYLNEPLLRRDENPLLWWSERKKVYPLLYEIMKRRLCIMATSVPCERIFSKAGQVVTNRRSRLDSKKISEILFLNHNM